MTGQIKAGAQGQWGAFEGPIEGTVNGDTFGFRSVRGEVSGKMQVSGDEMNGTATGMGPVSISLRRQP